MNRIFFLIAVLFLCFSSNIMATWDIWFNGMPVGSEWTMRLISLPFEGYNGTDTSLRFTRRDTILNGIMHRRIVDRQTNIVTIDSQIVYHYNEGQLASCFYEGGANGVRAVWGFGKYLVTIQIANEPDEKYVFIWNSLDSKMGTDNFHEKDYHIDWYFGYISSLPARHRLHIWSGHPVQQFDTLYAFDPQNPVIPEIKIWKLLYPTKPNPEEPWERKFYARTTPFGVSPVVIEKYNLKHFILGTTVILDGVYPNNGSLLDKYGYNTFLGPYPYNYWQIPPIAPGQNLTGYTYCTPGGWYKDWDVIQGFKLTAIQNDTLILKSNMRLWVSGFWENLFSNRYLGDTIIFSLSSTLKKESNAQINTYLGGCLIDSGANTIWASGSFHKAYDTSSLEYYGNLEHTVNNGGHIEINRNATLKLGDNTTLIFDGLANANTYLKLNKGAKVILGNDAQIIFKNGAYLDADSATFTNPNGYWQGITLENAGANTNIRYCTFSKAKVAVYFNNTGTGSFSYPFFHNTFNIQNPDPNIYYRAFFARNLYNMSFKQNVFNLSGKVIGVLIQNSSNPPGGGSSPSLLSFTENNSFSGGYVQALIAGYATTNIPVFISGNTFSGGEWCFAGRMITGTIENNNMTRTAYAYTMGLWQSNPNLTNNNITNQNGGTVYLVSSYPQTAPIINEQNNLIWYGGSNHFTAVNGDNIHFSMSNPALNNGSNCFSISNPGFYHLYGSVPTAMSQYNATRNGWQGNGGSPKHYLYYFINDTVVHMVPQVIFLPTTSCPPGINYNSYILNELGSEIYDTVWVSENTTGDPAPPDEVLYSQAMEYYGNAQYFDAIINFKNLIDNYSSSNYLLTSLSNLFTCYEGLDTSDQNHRDLIFSELKNYLVQKIEQYWYNVDFVNTAYNLILMCEAKIQNYNEAMTGYEFISLYHPDPEQRVWASMDYGYILELINGMGGGEISVPKKTSKTSILKLMDKKPYTKIVKNLFTRESKKLEKEINSDAVNTDKSLYHKKEMVERARQNISLSKSLTKQQREERRMEDIKMLIKDEGNNSSENMNIIPKSYSLHQNYPNPFNPITTIKYELPKDGLISLKIYDILGREIYSINEFKKAGIYDLKFDGTNYASGIYFYRLEAGNYVETKKMVLVK